jgi:hypothetical protein
MSIEDLNEISIILNHLTLIKLKMQQLERIKPRPENYYAIYEELFESYNMCKDELIETAIAINMVNPKFHPISQNTNNQ